MAEECESHVQVQSVLPQVAMPMARSAHCLTPASKMTTGLIADWTEGTPMNIFENSDSINEGALHQHKGSVR